MICNVPYIEERFRESNPDIADILNQEYETIFNKLIESKLFKNEDNTLKLSYAKTKKYLKQLDFINNINQEYETEIVTNINRTISVNVLPLYNKLDVINKPKYYMKDNVSVKTNINLERVPVQQVIIDINKEILDTVTHVLEFLNSKGFNPVIVGGAVRDAIVGDKPKDIDIEVYGITVEDLESILSNYGKVDAVGKSFGVLKFIPYNANGKLVELEEPFDFSVPRRENKVGLGYKGFEIELSDDISIEEAATRRDFTWNSMGYNPITNTLYDYYGGINDLAEGIIRHTSSKFAEDPLRILRALQFQARKGHVIAPETYELMSSIVDRGEFDHLAINELYNTFLKEKMRLVKEYKDHIDAGNEPDTFYEYEKYLIFTSMITRERITGEWDKWATKGKYHSKLFDFLRQSGLGEKLYPELMQLVNTKQDTVYHPEGNVEEHTKQVMAKANEIAEREKLSVEEKQILMLSTLLHDIAKPNTTKEEWSDKLNRFKVTSRGHEQAGEAIALDLLERIGIKEEVRIKIGKLVAEHLAHANISSLPSSNSNITPLSARGVFDTTALIEHDNDKITFLMYNLLGKIVGTQLYNPEGKKVAKNKKEPLKYILKGQEGQTLIFGMHTYNPDSPYLFVVEGVFDALMLHQQGYPAIAVLSAVPDINTKNQIELLNGKKIGILDNDDTNTGLKLRNFVDEYHVVPIEKDLNDLYTKDITEFNKFIAELDKKYKAAKGMYKPLRTSYSFSKQKKSAFAKLVNRLAPANVEQLVMLMEADMLGRNNNNLDTPVSITEFMELLEDYKNTNKGKLSFEPILTGKHLIKAGVKPGKGMGEILAKAKEAQLNLDFTDETESLEWLSNYLSTQDNDTILLEDKVKGTNMKELSIKTVISNIRTLLPKSNVELLNTLIESIKQNESSPILILAQMSREYKNGTLDKADLLAATFDKMADKNKEAIMAAIKSSYNMSDDNDVMNKLGELLVNKDNALILSSGVLGSLYRGVHNFFNSFEGNKEDIVKTISTIYDIDDTITDDMILHSERFKLFNKNNPYTSEKENLDYFKRCR